MVFGRSKKQKGKLPSTRKEDIQLIEQQKNEHQSILTSGIIPKKY